MENATKETIMNLFKDIRKQNPNKLIFLLIDNFSSHKANDVKNIAKELNIELCYLPPYSPQLQPIEKVWYKNKRDNMKYKIDKIKNFRKMDKEEKLDKLKEIERLYYLLERGDWDKDIKIEIETKIDVLEEIVNDLVRVA